MGLEATGREVNVGVSKASVSVTNSGGTVHASGYRDIVVNEVALPVHAVAAAAQLGALLTAYQNYQGVPINRLADHLSRPPSIIRSIFAGTDFVQPWSMYERLITVLQISGEDRQVVRELWDRRGLDRSTRRRPATQKNSLYRLRADLPGHELKPDPLRASTKEEFLLVMREFHIWAGEPSYREIALNANKAVGASTLCEALDANKPSRLPTLKVVTAFIYGCGGSEEDLATWTTAWRRVRMARTSINVIPLQPERLTERRDAG